MSKFITAATLAAVLVLPISAFAASDSSNDNGSKENPQSSAAVTPNSSKHSAGTVGAMSGAEGRSFTASPKDQKENLTKTK